MDNVWEQKKLKARKMLENGEESHLSSARCVRRRSEIVILKTYFHTYHIDSDKTLLFHHNWGTPIAFFDIPE
ncbi:hypothetical protein ACFLUA_03620 [Chloroflexota bacterium]